jgi:hypothetical protein
MTETATITARFEIGFHALRKKIVSGTLTPSTLVLTRIVSMQGLLRQNYAVLLFQNTDTDSALYTCNKQWIVRLLGRIEVNCKQNLTIEYSIAKRTQYEKNRVQIN